MGFNGSGVFNPLITFSPNTLARAEDQNSQDQDIATGLSTCITVNGQSTITANIPFNGFRITGLANPVNPQDAVTLATLSGYLLPSGTVTMFAGISPPSGYLLCNGSGVSRMTYATLFSAIGTSFGAGDGSTTFNLPNFQSVVPIGVGTGSGLSTYTLGQTGGEQTHVLTTTEMPSHTHSDAGHTHGVSDPGHYHQVQNLYGLGGIIFGQGTVWNSSTPFNTTVSYTGISINYGAANIQNTGGGAAHNNIQPYLAINFIIKT